jgi:hypothetical protein
MVEVDRPTKVFCLGLSRTGTASFASAMQLLGYRTIHFPFVSFRYGRLLGALGLDELRIPQEILDQNDAFADTTIIPFYRRFDEQYPGSKFVLTVREKDAWLDSCSRFPRFAPSWRPGAEVRALRRLVYGCETFDPEAFSSAYDRHHAGVAEYFAGRGGDLLTLDICGGEGWEPLCAFLGHRVPEQAFPRENVGSPPA